MHIEVFKHSLIGYFCPAMMKGFQVSQFSNFFLVGVDHKTAPINIRERFSLDQSQVAHLIHNYKQLGGDAMFVLSTCNRTELYGFGNCPRRIIDLFCRISGVDHETFFHIQNIKQNREAIEHLFRVGAGMESKILGDFEIIGQIKKDFLFSKAQEAHNAFLERLVNSAIQASKRVKNETELSTGASSAAFAVVQTVKEHLQSGVFGPDSKVVLVGTGKIGRTACENLVNQTQLNDITLINRTLEKAERLAVRFGIKHLGYAHLEEQVDQADIIIVATGASRPTVLSSAFVTQKPRLLLDLSVPRNVEPILYNREGFKVVDIDHLTTLTQESLHRRQKEIPKAESIINEMIGEFYQWLESRKVAPTLQAMREKMDHWKQKEVRNLLKKFPGIEEEQALLFADQLLNRLTGQFARQLRVGEDINSDLRTIHHIFELDNQTS